MCICICKAAREEGLNEGIRAMFSAGLGGALMKVFSSPFQPDVQIIINLLITRLSIIEGFVYIFLIKSMPRVGLL